MNQTSTVQRSDGSPNVIPALASFFIPGLGQLIQGRVIAAAMFFIVTGVGYFFWVLIFPLVIALLVHLWCIVDAARHRG